MNKKRTKDGGVLSAIEATISRLELETKYTTGLGKFFKRFWSQIIVYKSRNMVIIFQKQLGYFNIFSYKKMSFQLLDILTPAKYLMCIKNNYFHKLTISFRLSQTNKISSSFCY